MRAGGAPGPAGYASGGPTRRVVLALGANLGDKRATLERAVAELRRAPWIEVERLSAWHATEPVGGPPDQPRYLNGVLIGRTALAPRPLLVLLQELERALGRRREREVRFGPRPIDLDLLLLGDLRVDEPGLEVPHPRMEQRAFVLGPLAEVAPDLRLPSGRTAAAALAALPDEAGQFSAASDDG